VLANLLAANATIEHGALSAKLCGFCFRFWYTEFDTLGIWPMPSTTLHQLALGDE
jgi:hypothetical protein